MDEGMLRPTSDPMTGARNSTPLSELCERIVRAFLRSGERRAEVAVELTGYGADELYEGLRRTCGRKAYRLRAAAHRRGQSVMVERLPGRREAR